MLRTALTVVTVALFAVSSGAEAQPHCRKGIPCGGSCIAANKTCHVGSSTSPSEARSTRVPLVTAAEDPEPGTPRQAVLSARDSALLRQAEYVGSKADSVFFRKWCIAAEDLAASNRRYFRTATEAIAAGFRRSRAEGC